MRLSARILVLSILIIVLLVSLVASRTNSSQKVFSVSPHVVISEIQIRSSASADDEFVELYNPTGTAIDLTGWKLTKRTQSGTQSNLVASISGMIPAKGYFLITSQEAAASPSADQVYSTTQRIAADNTVTLLDNTSTIIDLVGLGAATVHETAGIANPVNNGSVERKAQSSSTEISMGPGGVDEFSGNGWDTDNNSLDFVQRAVSQPQNSTSSTEPPSSIPTPSPTSSPSPTPTNTPTSIVTPTPTPTSTPTPSLTPSPTSTPSHTPTVTPSPTPSPTLTNTPTATPPVPVTPRPTPISDHFPRFTLVCTARQREVRTPLGTLHFSVPQCRIVRI
jgi:hypothetical protein